MKLRLVLIKTTKNFVYYETPETDFRYPYRAVVKLWIPMDQIETNLPGVYPGEIEVRIMDDGTMEVVDRHPETGIPWNHA